MEHSGSVFYNEVVKKHQLPDEFKRDLNDVSEDDYKGKNYFPGGVLCIDLDKYEKSLGKATLEATVDAIVGIADLKGSIVRNKRLLLVEFKMKQDSFRNIEVENIIQKENHSRDILGGVAIDDFLYLLYKKDIVNHARHFISRKSYKKKWTITTPVDFYKMFSVNDCVIYDKYSGLKNCLDALVKECDWNGYEQFITQTVADIEKQWNNQQRSEVRDVCKILLKSINEVSKMSDDNDFKVRLSSFILDLHRFKG